MTNNTAVRPGLTRPPVGPLAPIDANTAAASAMPIKDDTDLAVESLARQLMQDYDVTPEQAMQMARAQVMQTQDAQAASGYDSPAARLAQAHADAGASPERAARRAANQVQTYGPTGASGLAAEYETPEGMSRLLQAQSEIDADDARHQAMYDNYFRDTASPTHWSVPPEEAARDEYRQRWNQMFDDYQRDGLHPQQPIDPGTPEQNARWNEFLNANPDEMARYRPGAAQARDQAASEQQLQGDMPRLVKRYGPEEAAKAAEARRAGRTYVPNTKEQRERNQTTEDLETTAMQGNTASRAFLQQRDERRMDYVARPRQLRELGLAADLNGPGLNAALGLPEAATQSEADARIRSLLRDGREKDKQAKDLLWRPRTMIQAGNAIGALALHGMGEWQASAIRGGPTPLDVQARQADMAAKMAQQAVTGFLANTPPPMNAMQQEAREAQIDTLPPEQQTAVSIRRGEAMGTGRSAAHVQSRWNYWMNNFGPRPVAWREENFRAEMEGLGYKPAQIDAWIDARRGRDAAAEDTAAPPIEIGTSPGVGF